jgi:molybdate transport system substrate-binding protein
MDDLMHDFSRFVASAVLAALLVALPVRPRATSEPTTVLVFAAASMQTALDALAPAAERSANVRMKVSYAASSALARQIENGAPADVFVSADLDWMDELAAKHLIRPDSRTTLVTNALVLVAPRGAAPSLTIGPGFPLGLALGSGRLALADPSAVPAGKYAKAALTSLGVWSSVESRIASTEDVRAALRLVSRGEAPLGIVYRSDAVADPGVAVVGTFPATSHPPIVYPIAVTATSAHADAAAALLAYLRSPAARAVFTAQGFGLPTAAPSARIGLARR